MQDVWRQLSQLEVQFIGTPEAGRIRFFNWLFDDALTKDELYRRLLVVYRALSITREMYSREFNRLVRRTGTRQQRSQQAPLSWFGAQPDQAGALSQSIAARLN